MELLILLAYTSLCIAAFALLRIPLTRVSVPVASIGGIILVFALVQLLNFYHPYSDSGGQYASGAPIAPAFGESRAGPVAVGEASLVAWFNPNNRFRVGDGATAEVTFASIPGKVFSARVRGVLPTPGQAPARAHRVDAPATASRAAIPVLLTITDPRFRPYREAMPGVAHAQAAVYGENLQQLALLRQTLLRMSAWLNYLSPVV